MGWWDELKKPLYKLVAQDSRNAAWLGNALGLDYLEQEGKKNTDNPGRAIGKAAATAAAMYAGGLFGGGAGSAGGGAASAAGQAGAGAGAAGTAGLYGAGSTVPAATQEALAMQAAQQVAQRGGTAALANSGMFAQVPGVTNGTVQAAMLAEQNAGMGGAAADLTAKAAMTPVKDAYQAGRMSFWDYAGNTMKADAAGMNDPAVWWDRAKTNMGRAAGDYGKSAAKSYLTQGMFGQPQQQAPSSWRAPQGRIPKQESSEEQRILADLKAGRITEDEARRKLQALGAI